VRPAGLVPRRPVLALAAVIVPAVIVAVLGYVSLRQWATSAELLFREQARDMAVMAADKIQMVVRQTEDEVLAGVQAALADRRPDGLSGVQGQMPSIDRLYVFDRAGRLLYPRESEESAARAMLALAGELSPGFWERGGRRHFVVGPQAGVAAVLNFPGVAALAIVILSPEGMRRVFEAAMQPLQTPTAYAVLDSQGRPLYTQAPVERDHLIAAVPFREGFPTWQMALYQPPDSAPRAAVRRQIMIFTAAFGVLLLVIAAGIVATWRLVRRETEMARLKADFVANVSHDLKTPVSVIRMFGETLEMGRLPDEATRREYYRVITRESERLTHLIDNVLDFSRIESGRRAYTRLPTAVEPLVRETLEAFSYPLAQEGFKVHLQVVADLPEVPLDADAVGQALGNLIDNAIKYSGDRKVLTIEARVTEGRLALTVADEGIGIPREEQERIFDKFYRVGRSETQGRRGSGVGLALVRHVADAHGGRVTVESGPGEGSRFTLWLPLG
jgi:signal transduction histidine kinase